MLEAAEVGNKLDKKTYRAKAPEVRTALLAVQKRLATTPLAPVVVVGGAEGAGKSETVSLLLEWMDQRGIQTNVAWTPSDEEREWPEYWRFWRRLPPRGKIGILFGSWYTRPIVERAFGRMHSADFERAMRRIRDFERMLTYETGPVLKFWLHLSRKEEHKRLKRFSKDPRFRWRLHENAKEYFEHYDDFRPVDEEMLRLTNTGYAPWSIVEAADDRYRDLTVATSLLQTLEEAVEQAEARARARARAPRKAPALPKAKRANVIRNLDLSLGLSAKEYDERLASAQADVGRLTRKLAKRKRALLAALAVWITAGRAFLTSTSAASTS